MNAIEVEIKKILCKKVIYIGILISCIAGGVMAYVAYHNPESFQFRHTQAFYSAYFMDIVIIYLIIDNIYAEYNQGTMKLLCNNEIGINKVFINKMISFLIVSLFLSVFNIVFNIVCYNIVESSGINIINFSLQRVVIYFFYVLTVYATTVFAYSFTKKNTSTLGLLIILFYLAHDIIDMLGNKLDIAKSLLDYIPFYSLYSGMQGFYFNFSMVIGSLILSIALLIIGLFKISRQDIC